MVAMFRLAKADYKRREKSVNLNRVERILMIINQPCFTEDWPSFNSFVLFNLEMIQTLSVLPSCTPVYSNPVKVVNLDICTIMMTNNELNI